MRALKGLIDPREQIAVDEQLLTQRSGEIGQAPSYRPLIEHCVKSKRQFSGVIDQVVKSCNVAFVVTRERTGCNLLLRKSRSALTRPKLLDVTSAFCTRWNERTHRSTATVQSFALQTEYPKVFTPQVADNNHVLSAC